MPTHSFYGFSASQDTPLFVGPSDGYVYRPPQSNPNSKSASIDQLLNEIEREYGDGQSDLRYNMSIHPCTTIVLYYTCSYVINDEIHYKFLTIKKVLSRRTPFHRCTQTYVCYLLLCMGTCTCSICTCSYLLGPGDTLLVLKVYGAQTVTLLTSTR